VGEAVSKSYSFGTQIWVLEDDAGCQFVYEEILSLRYKLRVFSDVSSFRNALRDCGRNCPSLVIADIRLPDESFISFLSSDESLELFKDWPFLVVSSVDDIDALRLCYEKGAIDYITKPFGKAELVVKVERILACRDPESPTYDCTTDIELDPVYLTIGRRNHQERLGLTNKEMQIVSMIMHSPDRKVSRTELTDKIWGDAALNSKTLDVHMFNLRRKLKPLGIVIKHVSHLYTIAVSSDLENTERELTVNE
jgi:DNA-binding response OmpR family regulator